MVNATQMAKSFGKEPKFWLMSQSTDYLNELSKVRNLTLTDLVQVTKEVIIPVLGCTKM